MTNDKELKKTHETDETKQVPPESGELSLEEAQKQARSMFDRARSAVAGGIERAQETAGPRLDQAKEAIVPGIERAKEAGTAGAERAQQAAERAFGAEFRREFERYINAASTTILGLHEDQTALLQRMAELEVAVEKLRERLDGRENNTQWPGPQV